MADSFIYDLPDWWNSPVWWKQFVNSLDPDHEMSVTDLLITIQLHLDKWQIVKDRACLICENPDIFHAFVLAYSN